VSKLDFGEWLAKRRNDSGLSQRELAKKCDLSPAYVAALERGTSDPPPLRTCKAFARALATNWEDVWDHSFATRLRKWLRREGFSGMSETELLEIVQNIKSISK
jgi:transcriptional regulator with XRE-family HTH domain